MAVLAAMALGADPDTNATPAPNSEQSFLAAVQATGITGLAPAVLTNGYNVCWQLWQGHYTDVQVAAGLQKTYPTLTTDQAGHFVIDAYQDLCPVPGVYDWWTYGTGGAGGGAAAAG
jgi:Protein of unknown function (DUF732)